MQSMRAEMQDWLKMRDAPSILLQSFEERWNDAVRGAVEKPEGPCPTWFRHGKVAIEGGSAGKRRTRQRGRAG